MIKQLSLVPLLEQFIKETASGKRRKLNGERILPCTIQNYQYVLKHVKDYEQFSHRKLTLAAGIRNNRRLILKEFKYWKNFYRHFSDYLLCTKKCFDNFTGSVFKTLKCFFRYLKLEKQLEIANCYKSFYVRKEDIRVIALLPEQYCFLISDKAFQEKLTPEQRRCKDFFVFGCTCALRYSDLRNLLVKNIEKRCGHYYLVFYSLKTGTPVHVKLPAFAIKIYEGYSLHKKPNARLFPCIALSNFNLHLKAIGHVAGWTEAIGKIRARNGVLQDIQTAGKNISRFCDQLSSHLMRKTGITVLLMLGMPEYLVRKISGHSANSKEFFRYVNFSQSYITSEIDKAHQKLIELYQS